MTHLKMHTQNKTDANIAKIAALFPACVTEAKAEDGSITRKIDFDVLRQELSGSVVEGREERYQFTWPDKRAAILAANAPINKTLRPCRKESVDFDSTENLYIEGDNLEALKLLQETYLGKIKMIYIDPPYNTGNDFVYSDQWTVDSDQWEEVSGQRAVDSETGEKVRLTDNYTRNTESNGRFHTDWLNMMYPRLKLARDLLSDDGVIFISIDDNEVDNLKKICNEVFGENNLVAEIPWQSRASVQNDTDFSVNHEYICVYAKNRRQENRRLKESNASEWHKRDSFVCKPLPLDKSKFDNPDNLPELCDEKSEAYKAGYKNICEIGKERIRRAGAQILKCHSERSEESIDVSATPQHDGELDIGFRVLKIDTSNMEDVYYSPERISTADFFKDNIKADRTGEDLLFQVMLDLGILLSSKIKTRQIDGKNVFFVEGNYLVACFDEKVDEETITKIAKEKPYYFVMRDSSMASDSVATNFEQIFATYSPETVRRVI